MQYITNIREEIKLLINNLKKSKNSYISNMDDSNIIVFNDLEDSILKNAITQEPQLKLLKPQRASYFDKKKVGVQEWHVDIRNNLKNFLICSWPHQTEFLIVKNEAKLANYLKLKYNESNRYQNAAIQKALKLGYATIFTPKRGEVWLANATQIHRSKPLSLGKAGVLIRWWLTK